MHKYSACFLAMVVMLLCLSAQSQASSQQTYQQSLQLAATGHEAEAIAALYASASVMPDADIWKARLMAAATLLDLRHRQQTTLTANAGSQGNLALAAGFSRVNQPPQAESEWPVFMLAVLIPGAGHVWLGRMRDAGAAAVMVWPLLILTLWAMRRKMGPVTVFFALITIWLWSGTVFSAISLAERVSAEAYMLWWQGLWQASALPGKPW